MNHVESRDRIVGRRRKEYGSTQLACDRGFRPARSVIPTDILTNRRSGCRRMEETLTEE